MSDQDDFKDEPLNATDVAEFIQQKAFNATEDVIHGVVDLLIGGKPDGYERMELPYAAALQARFAEVIRDFLRTEVPEVSGLVGEG